MGSPVCAGLSGCGSPADRGAPTLAPRPDRLSPLGVSLRVGVVDRDGELGVVVDTSERGDVPGVPAHHLGRAGVVALECDLSQSALSHPVHHRVLKVLRSHAFSYALSRPMYGAAATGTAFAGNVVNGVEVNAPVACPVSFQPTARGAVVSAPVVEAAGMYQLPPPRVASDQVPVPMLSIFMTSQYRPMSGSQLYWLAGLS